MFSPDSSSLGMSLRHRRIHSAANTGQLGIQPSTHPPGSALVRYRPPVPEATPPTWSSALESTHSSGNQTLGSSLSSRCILWHWWYLQSATTSLTRPFICCPCRLQGTQDPASGQCSVDKGWPHWTVRPCSWHPLWTSGGGAAVPSAHLGFRR